MTKSEYYQSLSKGYEESAFENQDTIITFKDMISEMYKPFPGLSNEHNRIMNSIRLPYENSLGGSKWGKGPFTGDMSSIGRGVGGPTSFIPQNKSE